jgi:hypothetical protein
MGDAKDARAGTEMTPLGSTIEFTLSGAMVMRRISLNRYAVFPKQWKDLSLPALTKGLGDDGQTTKISLVL